MYHWPDTIKNFEFEVLVASRCYCTQQVKFVYVDGPTLVPRACKMTTHKTRYERCVCHVQVSTPENLNHPTGTSIRPVSDHRPHWYRRLQVETT